MSTLADQMEPGALAHIEGAHAAALADLYRYIELTKKELETAGSTALAFYLVSAAIDINKWSRTYLRGCMALVLVELARRELEGEGVAPDQAV